MRRSLHLTSSHATPNRQDTSQGRSKTPNALNRTTSRSSTPHSSTLSQKSSGGSSTRKRKSEAAGAPAKRIRPVGGVSTRHQASIQHSSEADSQDEFSSLDDERQAISLEATVSQQEAELQSGDDLEGRGDAENQPQDVRRGRKNKKTGEFVEAGRLICRTIVAFQDLHSVFNEGLIRVSAQWPTSPDAAFDDSNLEAFPIPLATGTDDVDIHRKISDEERGLLYKLFCKIYRKLPEITMKILASDGTRFTDLIGDLVTGSNFARSTDLHAVREVLEVWYPEIRSVAKTSRGFYNDITTTLLRPANVDITDQDTIAQLREEESLSFPPAGELPRFLYSGKPESMVDVDSPKDTILRGPFHLAAYCRIYQSDKSAIRIFTKDGEGALDTLSAVVDAEALRQRRTGTPVSVGNSSGVTEATAHGIAYSGCLLRAALSSSEKLMENDDSASSYNYTFLYREIVETLTPDDTPAVNKTIEAIYNWWTKCAYPKKQGPVSLPPPRLRAKDRLALQLEQEGESLGAQPNRTGAKPITEPSVAPNANDDNEPYLQLESTDPKSVGRAGAGDESGENGSNDGDDLAADLEYAIV